MKEIIEKLVKFRDERGWKSFNTPENIAKSIVIESAELLELYQWKSEVSDIERLEEELADVFIYACFLASHYNFDVEDIIAKKMEKNGKKYPVEKCYGSCKKYTEY